MILITSFEMDRQVKPVEDCDFPRMAVVPESSRLTVTLVGERKIIINGDGFLPAMHTLDKLLEAAEELRLNPQKDSVTIDFPREE